MEAGRLWIVVALGCTLSWQAGCRTSSKLPSDPFATKTSNAAESTPQVPASSTAQPVTPVSYEASTASSGTPTPGASLNGLDDTKSKSWWQRSNETLSSKELKKQYKSLTGHAPDENVAKQAYNEGDALFREGKYKDAAEKFAVAVDRWPDSLLEEDAMYMLGESYFFDNQYHKARNTFDGLLKKYENSRHLDRVTTRQFAIGRFWDEDGRKHYMMAPNFTDKTRPWFDTHGNGLKVYENIRLTDPTGPLADDAVMAQGTAYFLDARFEDAAYQYEILRKDYSQSEHQKQAHLLGLQSYMNSYMGPQYDPTPLKKADTLVDSTLRNLGHQITDERPRLQQAKESIRAQQAEREYDLGEYYFRLGYNRAARQHYANVLRDFPDTKFAELAQRRTEESEKLPQEPPDYFPWLTKWLGRH
jgi:TolA-binding protein